MRIGYWIHARIVGKDEKLFATENLREEFNIASMNDFDSVRLSYTSASAPALFSRRRGDQELRETSVAEIKRLAQESNLVIDNVTSGGNHLDPDLEARKKWNTLLKETVDFCHLLEVDVVATDVGSPAGTYIYGLPGLFGISERMSSFMQRDPRRSRVDEAIQMYKEVMTPLAEHAESLGVKVAFENNFRAMAGNIAQGPYIWDRMFKAVPSKATGLRIDPSHFICLMIGPVDSIIRKYGDRIYAVDGKDCEIIPEMLQAQGIYGNLWWRYRIPGYGDLNWARIVSALMDVGYKGGIIVENEDPVFPGRPGVLKGAEYLRKFIPKEEEGLRG